MVYARAKARDYLFMSNQHTILIVPPNDAEAILIAQIALALNIPTIQSKQTHGASLDKGHDYTKEIKAGKYQRVVVVEMPGPKMETRIRRMGVDFQIIDHHHYVNLERACDPKTGKLLPSSLEQFLKLFRVSDVQLTKLGFDPVLVRGIGVMDRGFIWALQEEGRSKKEIDRVLAYHDQLIGQIQNPKTEARKNRAAASAWKRRQKWNGYFVVETRANLQLRPRLSRIVALELKKPTPLIIIERARKLIYVQESDHAMRLFRTFGGFTFGGDRNWGYVNEKGKPKVTLKEIKQVLSEHI